MLMVQLSLPELKISAAGMSVPLKLAVSEVEEFSVMTNVSAPCAEPPTSKIGPATSDATQIIPFEFIFLYLWLYEFGVERN
jgi:hypothetical protein